MTEPIESAVSPTGYVLRRGMEVSLPKQAGRIAGRYEITAIERETSGKIVLTVHGPLRTRSKEHHHYINPSAIVVTHTKTKNKGARNGG